MVKRGNIFVLRGMQWRILNIDEKALQVNVEPISGAPKNVPYWEGENIPIDYDTAQKVGLFRNKVKHGSLTMLNKIIPELDFNIIPDEKTIVIESVRTVVMLLFMPVLVQKSIQLWQLYFLHY